MNKPPFPFVHEDFPLAPHTYYRVGGPARWALLPSNAKEMEAAYAWLLKQPVPRLILGGGSNVLIDDAGFRGAVLFTTGLTEYEALGGGRYCCGAGLVLDTLVQEIMVRENFKGVGALAGIPGTVGGAIFMNAGTANGDTCGLLESVELLTPSGRFSVAMEPALHAYRRQTFCAPGDVIVGGVFRFTRAEENQRAVFEHYIERRRQRQPQGYCCGSVFKNPEGRHAGQLIEQCGLMGTRQGGAVISPVHANFIMNEDQATFEDIMGLITLAKRRVFEEFGVKLEEEVRIISGAYRGF